LAQDGANYGQKAAIIPITDIAVAAGGGMYNNDHIEVEDALHLPSRLVKPGHTYLCVKIKGLSMAPTLQDGGYVVIRLLDKSEWANMPDQRIFVVIDTEGKSYVKRVKNRFKRGFIVMRSDSMDQHNYPTLNLDTNEIAAIWYVEWYFSAKMPNINDQYYHRLQLLEEKVDDLVSNANLVKAK
jgi:phage repressor protein C with HTH and peptisase S24 domain